MTDERPTTGVVFDDATPSTVVERALACVVCEYPLRGLERDSVCPECGAPIQRSLRGDRLRHADPAYLRKLRLGIRLVLAPFIIVIASIVLAIAGTFVGLLLPGGSGQPVLKVLWWIATITVLVSAIGWPIGWFLFSSHEPGVDRPVWQRRYLVRAGSVIMCSAFLALFFAPFTQGIAMAVVDVSAAIAAASICLHCDLICSINSLPAGSAEELMQRQ